MKDISGAGWNVMFGSCLDRLPELADNSIDAVVTDPPYELGFMGKSWDSSGIAFNAQVWAECLRVLKPGGHLLAFGGSRTWHRIAVAIEDAGFEVRDSIAWLYGSGFPKSLDVSKAIDKQDATEARANRNLAFTTWMRSTELTRQKATELLRDAGVISEHGTMAGHFFAETMAGQPAIATAELFDVLRPNLPKVPDYIEAMVAERTIESENFKKREVIGKKTSGIANKDEKDRHTIGASQSVVVEVTAPATAEAQKWAGWGTALKPAFEPVVVARKPLVGTVAANVLEWGTGGLNIDGTRVPTDDRFGGGAKGSSGFAAGYSSEGWTPGNAQGRWPANVMLDEYTAALLDEQSGVSKDGVAVKRNSAGNNIFSDTPKPTSEDLGYGGSGGASRFFYVAKASKRDRNEGLDGLEAQRHSDREKVDGVGGDNPRKSTNQARQNFHPTVKPTDLMRQLVRLVTPPGGVVLDPFTGSGSTGKAAILEGFEFVGVELTEDYLPIIEGRLSHAVDTVSERGKADDEKLF